jgi:NAD(P)H-nitrite reductase large subunit
LGRPSAPRPADGPVICTCFGITAAGMRRIIAERRCATVEDVSEATGACRGCQTCRPDIEEILRETAS